MKPVALVTGGQSGIGLGISEALAASGFSVAMASLPEADAPEVRDALDRVGNGARYFQIDLAEIERHPALLDQIETDLGPVSCLVSNAGVPARVRGDMLDMSPESFDFVLGINLRGTFFLAQDVARRMAAREADHFRSLIFVTSVSADMASVERAEYCMSKSAAAMVARLFAVRLAPLGIGVYDLRPGIIETGMTAGVRGRYDDAISGGLVPAARWGTPGDIGTSVVPLALGQMAFATGTTIAVDGGLSIPRL